MAGLTMSVLAIVAVALAFSLCVLGYEMLRVPTGIERLSHIAGGRIYSRTSAVVNADQEKIIRFMHHDWSWWKKSRAEAAKDLGDGRKEFYFYPVCFLNILKVPPKFLVKLEKPQVTADGGQRIAAIITEGDFEGKAEYSARNTPRGTVVEMAWCGVEPRGALSYAPRGLVAAVHCWRERIGMQGLLKQLGAK
jgi:hypothetical protein